MGGSDQWGNITTGTELIRRIDGNEAFGMTCPLITKADGGKFGKTESGNVWLDAERTSPYAFYQFWLNVSDDDAAKYIKIFTTLTREEIAALEAKQAATPHLRPLQKRLAEEITILVHGEEELRAAEEASQILFGQGTSEMLHHLKPATILDVFGGVPQFKISKDAMANGVKVIDLLTEMAPVFKSKGELRKLIQSGGISINKEKIDSIDAMVTADNLLNGSYIVAQKGKKNYFLLIAE